MSRGVADGAALLDGVESLLFIIRVDHGENDNWMTLTEA